MPVRVSISQAAVTAKVESAFRAGLPQLSEAILSDCNRYCKEDTGTLIASSLVHSKPDRGLLIWQTPYARRQYWEIRTAYKDVNPGATWRWCEAAKRHCVDKWRTQAQRALEMNL